MFYFGFYFAILLLYVWPHSKINVMHVTSILTLFSSDIVLPFFSTLEFRFVSGQSVFREHNRIIYNENTHSLMQNISRLNFLLCHNKRGNVIATRLTIIINATAFFSICRAFRMQVLLRALHSRKRLAIRNPKSASSAGSGDEETTAKMEIYAPRNWDDERARQSGLTSCAHDSGNTRRCR